MGSKGEWDKGEGGGRDVKSINSDCKNALKQIKYAYRNCRELEYNYS